MQNLSWMMPVTSDAWLLRAFEEGGILRCHRVALHGVKTRSLGENRAKFCERFVSVP